MNERKSLKNYLSAVRAAKINIHKFSQEYNSHITHSIELNKSMENPSKYLGPALNPSRIAENPLFLNKNSGRHHKSPYRAEIFCMKGVNFPAKNKPSVGTRQDQ